MRILHFSTEKHWRGGEQQIAYLIAELNSFGIDNWLLCRRNSAMHKYAIEYKINHKAIRISNSVDPIAIFKANRIFDRVNPDFIHLHSSKAHTIALLANLIGKKQHFILHRRVSFPVSLNKVNKWKYNHPKIRKIVCISQDVKAQLSKIVWNQDKMTVIYSGIDLNRFTINQKNSASLKKELKIPEEAIVVTGIGALSPEKDFSTFVKAAHDSLKENDNLYFLIVGKGIEEEKINALINNLNVQKNIYLLGFRKDIPAILNGSDIFMLCSKSEGLGTSFLDAAASGCVLLGTRAGGIPEIIQDNQNGFLNAIDDYEEFARKLIILSKNDKLRKNMSEEAVKTAGNFSIKSMARDYLNLYKTLN